MAISQKSDGSPMIDPVNEMGTIIFFSQVCHQLGYEILKIQSACPDAIVRDTNTGKDLRVEFEYNSNSFRQHKHDPAAVDLIICWKKGRQTMPVPVLALSEMAVCPTELSIEVPSYGKYRPKKCSKVLGIDGKVTLYEQIDGSSVSFMLIHADGKGYKFEALREDPLPSSELIRQAVLAAKKIRQGIKGSEVDQSEAGEVIALIIEAIYKRSEEQHGNPSPAD